MSSAAARGWLPQARGEHNPRDFDKYVFQLPIPLYHADVDLHRDLAGLAERAEQVAAAVTLPAGKSFQTLRRSIRDAFVDDGVGTELDAAIRALFAPPAVELAPASASEEATAG